MIRMRKGPAPSMRADSNSSLRHGAEEGGQEIDREGRDEACIDQDGSLIGADQAKLRVEHEERHDHHHGRNRHQRCAQRQQRFPPLELHAGDGIGREPRDDGADSSTAPITSMHAVGHPGEEGAVDQHGPEILDDRRVRKSQLVDGVFLVALERGQDHEERRHQGEEGREQEHALLERRAGKPGERLLPHQASSSRTRRRARKSGKISRTETRKSRTEAAEAMPGRLVRIRALKM